MILLEDDWAKIKDQLSRNDQNTLMVNRCGQSIVPRAWRIDETYLPLDLKAKVEQLVKELQPCLNLISSVSVESAKPPAPPRRHTKTD